MTERATYTAALREFANWLDANPNVPIPLTNNFLLPLTTNDAVREFAARYGLDVDADGEGNLSANIIIGVLRYHAYGYTDFEQHKAIGAEREAREWAEKQGLELVEKASA